MTATKPEREPAAVDALHADREYWCFISYRHDDNKTPGRQWATWLHQALETYEVPTDLVGKTNSRGHVIPERIFPVFRDEEELPADAELSRGIDQALQRSRFLVVLCSPQAVNSKFVGKEILDFKKLGKHDYILAALIEGEPNASEDPAKPDVEKECFPSALRYHCDANGALTAERVEPIAADFRLADGSAGWTSPAPYRAALQSQRLPSREIEARVSEFSARSRTGFLKIVAGILGVPLRELTQREQAYQLAKQRQKAKSLRRWLSLVVVLLSLAVVFALFSVAAARYANDRRKVADEATQTALDLADRNLDLAEQKDGALKRVESEYTRAETQRAIAEERRLNLEKFTHLSMRLSIQRGTELPSSVGSLWLGRGLELARPEDRPYAEAVRYALTARSTYGDLSLGVLRHPDRVRSVWLSGDGMEAISACDDGLIREWTLRADGQIEVGAAFEGWPNAVAVTSKRKVVVGDAERGALLRTLDEAKNAAQRLPHDAFIERTAADAAEEIILTVGWDGNARLWNAASGVPLTPALEHQADVSCHSFSPDGTRLATGCWDGTTRLWNVADGAVVGAPTRHRQSVSAVAFSPDGRFFLSASRGGTLTALDASDGTAIGEPWSCSRPVTCVAVRPDGKLIAANGEPREVVLLRFEEGLVLHERLVLNSDCTSLAFSPDGRLLAAGMSDGRVEFRHVETGVSVFVSESDMRGDVLEAEPESAEVSGIVFCADGSRVAAIHGDDVSLWLTPIAVEGDVPAILRSLQSAAGGALADDGTVRPLTEEDRPTPDIGVEDPFGAFEEKLRAESVGTLIAEASNVAGRSGARTISTLNGEFVHAPEIREILSDHVATMRELVGTARELVAAGAPVISARESAAVEFDLAIAEACLAFVEADSLEQIDAAFVNAIEQGEALQTILKDSTDFGLSHRIIYQRSVSMTTLIRRAHLHAIHWREGADDPRTGVAPELSRLQLILEGFASSPEERLTPDELLLLRERVDVRAAVLAVVKLREEFGAQGGTAHRVEAASFQLDVERANVASAQGKSAEAFESLAQASRRAEKLSSGLREFQPFDIPTAGLFSRQDSERSFPDNLRWTIIADANARLTAAYLRETGTSEDFAEAALAPHLILCDWIIGHNVVSREVADQITREEVAILKRSEQTMNSILDVARLIRDSEEGMYSNVDVYDHAIPGVWMKALREFAAGNLSLALEALNAGAEAASAQRQISQVRIDAGLHLPLDEEHVRISLEEISLRKAVIRLRTYLRQSEASELSRDDPQ